MDASGRNGRKWTQMDACGRKRTQVYGNDRKWTEMDGNGRKWTQMDSNERSKWTELDEDGRLWTFVDVCGRFWTFLGVLEIHSRPQTSICFLDVQSNSLTGRPFASKNVQKRHKKNGRKQMDATSGRVHLRPKTSKNKRKKKT